MLAAAPTMNRAQRRQADRASVTQFSLPTMNAALRRATRLTARERALVMDPTRAGVAALRQGVATYEQWAYVCSAIQVGLAIEAQGIVRGLQAHMQAADQALQAVYARVTAPAEGPTWGRATALRFDELEAITDAVDLHDWQLQQLAAKEFHRAVKLAEKSIRKAGGKVLNLDQLPPEERKRLEDAARVAACQPGKEHGYA